MRGAQEFPNELYGQPEKKKLQSVCGILVIVRTLYIFYTPLY